MKKIEISINPLAEFLEATDSRKKKIITEQLDPDPVRIPYYQKARATIRKFILSNGDKKLIEDALLKIAQKTVTKDWQKNDKANSIISLQLWQDMHLPDTLLENRLECVQTKAKFLPLYNVHVKVSPTAIFRIEIEGKKYLGACKVHISKGKPFNIKQSAFVAQMLNQFLSNFVVQEDEIVDPQLCICIDPFAGTIISAANKIKFDMKQLKIACAEIKEIWNNETSSDTQSIDVA